MVLCFIGFIWSEVQAREADRNRFELKQKEDR